MTLEGLMDTIKNVYARTSPGPLQDRAWRVINANVARDMRSYLRSNPTASRIDYDFHVVVDSDGRSEYNSRTLEEANSAFARLLGGSRPENTLQVSIHVYRRGSGRVIVDVTSRRNSPDLLTIGRSSSTSPSGERVRDEGSRAVVRPGADMGRLASLSGGARPATASGTPAAGRAHIASAGSARGGAAGTRQATGQVPEQPAR